MERIKLKRPKRNKKKQRKKTKHELVTGRVSAGSFPVRLGSLSVEERQFRLDGSFAHFEPVRNMFLDRRRWRCGRRRAARGALGLTLLMDQSTVGRRGPVAVQFLLVDAHGRLELQDLGAQARARRVAQGQAAGGALARPDAVTAVALDVALEVVDDLTDVFLAVLELARHLQPKSVRSNKCKSKMIRLKAYLTANRNSSTTSQWQVIQRNYDDTKDLGVKRLIVDIVQNNEQSWMENWKPSCRPWLGKSRSDNLSPPCWPIRVDF